MWIQKVTNEICKVRYISSIACGCRWLIGPKSGHFCQKWMSERLSDLFINLLTYYKCVLFPPPSYFHIYIIFVTFKVSNNMIKWWQSRTVFCHSHVICLSTLKKKELHDMKITTNQIIFDVLNACRAEFWIKKVSKRNATDSAFDWCMITIIIIMEHSVALFD